MVYDIFRHRVGESGFGHDDFETVGDAFQAIVEYENEDVEKGDVWTIKERDADYNTFRKWQVTRTD